MYVCIRAASHHLHYGMSSKYPPAQTQAGTQAVDVDATRQLHVSFHLFSFIYLLNETIKNVQ